VRRNSNLPDKDKRNKIQKSFLVSVHFYESVDFTSYLYCIFPLHKSLNLFSSTKLEEAPLRIKFLLNLILVNSKYLASLTSKKMLVFIYTRCTRSILIFIIQLISNLVVVRTADHTIRFVSWDPSLSIFQHSDQSWCCCYFFFLKGPVHCLIPLNFG